MAKNTKAAKSTKRRTKVKKLSGSQKELTATEKKKVKGGLLPAVQSTALRGNTVGDSFGADTFASSFGSDKIRN